MDQPVPRRLPTLFAVAAVTLLATSAEAARTLEVSFTPTGAPQIAIWLETADGEFVDTIMVTRKVGTFGLGNRPGRADLGGGFLWPYGRREMTLPVWAHRRNVQYDRIVFQNCREGWLGWHELHSSQEPFYCRPVTPAENDVGVDTVSCPSHNFRSDKGWSVKRAKTDNSPECRHLVEMMPETSLYPPRNDLRNYDPTRDWSGIRDYSDANDLDTVTQATPPGQQRFRVTYQAPDALAARDYVVWVEINEEFDSNDSHNYAMFVDAALPDYGQSSIGQPSVVWKIPVTMGDADAVTAAKAYAGYGSPDGSDGRLRPPDNTITTDTEGSGSGRLVALDDAALGRHQVRVFYTPDAECPSPPPVSIKLS